MSAKDEPFFVGLLRGEVIAVRDAAVAVERTAPSSSATRASTGSTEWLAHAACRGRPTAWWYPEQDRFAGEVAVTVCRGCEVRGPCLAAALAEESAVGYPPAGIRGGLRPEQRRRLLRAAG